MFKILHWFASAKIQKNIEIALMSIFVNVLNLFNSFLTVLYAKFRENNQQMHNNSVKLTA